MLIEMNYLMQSLWHVEMVYFLFTFLFLCFVLLVVTSGEVAILMSYILLCKEDARWWWISFAASGSSGVYMMGYSLIYYMELNLIGIAGHFVYFGYMTLLSLLFGLITGTIGFLFTFYFIRSIFGMIKVD